MAFYFGLIVIFKFVLFCDATGVLVLILDNLLLVISLYLVVLLSLGRLRSRPQFPARLPEAEHDSSTPTTSALI